MTAAKFSNASLASQQVIWGGAVSMVPAGATQLSCNDHLHHASVGLFSLRPQSSKRDIWRVQASSAYILNIALSILEHLIKTKKFKEPAWFQEVEKYELLLDSRSCSHDIGGVDTEKENRLETVNPKNIRSFSLFLLSWGKNPKNHSTKPEWIRESF